MFWVLICSLLRRCLLSMPVSDGQPGQHFGGLASLPAITLGQNPEEPAE